jgi:hypothetical protein
MFEGGRGDLVNFFLTKTGGYNRGSLSEKGGLIERGTC